MRFSEVQEGQAEPTCNYVSKVKGSIQHALVFRRKELVRYFWGLLP